MEGLVQSSSFCRTFIYLSIFSTEIISFILLAITELLHSHYEYGLNKGICQVKNLFYFGRNILS